MRFIEGQYPHDATYSISVGSDGGPLQVLATGSIQALLVASQDLYVRGTDLNGANGFAYTSYKYNLCASSCSDSNVVGYIDYLNW